MNLFKNIPIFSGVYLMKDARGKILYIGKAVNLRRRVASYFSRSQDARVQKLVAEIRKIDYRKTANALEALILESRLIKKYQPPFNIKETDNKKFLYADITKEKFPRVVLSRGKGMFGPFVSAASIREALRIIRRIFIFSIHSPEKINKGKACFDLQIGLCPGTCISKISEKEYKRTIKNIKMLFSGKTDKLINGLKKEMKVASKNLEFEKAAKIKKQIFALRHIQDIALINDTEIRNLSASRRIEIRNFRIEGYDISNISGTFAVGSMVVFENGAPNKNEYRKFKIRNFTQPNDIGMLKEVLQRRLCHKEWPNPDLFLIDGGKGQVNVVKEILTKFGLVIPVIGIAKGPKRNKNEFVGKIPVDIDKKTLIRVRDEAHRFAIKYHRQLRDALK